LNAPGHLTVMDIEAGNDTFGNHATIETALATQGKRLLAAPDFSL